MASSVAPLTGKGSPCEQPRATADRDLLDALAAHDVVDTFQRLPLDEQDKFLTWIDRAPDQHAYWRRIDILVLGMRMAPLPESTAQYLRRHPQHWMNPMGRI